MARFLVTGGAGFIGSSVVRNLIASTPHDVLVVDKLSYAGNLDNLSPVVGNARYRFVQADICNAKAMRQTIAQFRPDVIMHLAAESHVDRSIDGPGEFIQTNVVGTFVLLQAALEYWKSLDAAQRSKFRFHHISTDEVFGSLGPEGLFSETSPYEPNSPYSASKASSDHLVRAWHHTFGLPTVVSNCSNNYGPYHFPEKLIPLTILKLLEQRAVPVYGAGLNVRDWLYVNDHADALILVASQGVPGQAYNIGGSSERTNIEVVRSICQLMNRLAPLPGNGNYEQFITYVTDRPGHDLRYAMDTAKIERELGWKPQETFESGLQKTVRWYLENRDWWERIRSGIYRGDRLGQAI